MRIRMFIKFYLSLAGTWFSRFLSLKSFIFILSHSKGKVEHCLKELCSVPLIFVVPFVSVQHYLISDCHKNFI